MQRILNAQSMYEPLLHRDLILTGTILADDVEPAPHFIKELAQRLGAFWWEDGMRQLQLGERGWYSGDPLSAAMLQRVLRSMRGLSMVKTILEPIRPALDHEVRYIRDDALRTFAVAAEWEPIDACMADSSHHDRGTVQKLILQYGDPERVNHALDTGKFMVDDEFAEAVIEAERWDIVEELLAHGYDLEQPDMLSDALAAAGQWDILDALWTNPKTQERASILHTYGAYGRFDVIEQVLDDPDDDVREAAIWAYVRTNQWEVVCSREEDDSPDVRVAVLDAYRELGNIQKLETALQDADSFVRLCAVHHLSTLGCVDALLPLTSDPDRSVRRHVAEAFGKARHDKPLVDMMHDDDQFVRSVVINALGECQRWDILLPLLGAENIKDRRAAFQAYANNGPWIDPMIAALTDLDQHIRHSALQAAARYGQWEIIESLLDHPLEEMQGAVLSALAKHPNPSMPLLDQIATMISEAKAFRINYGGRTTLKALIERLKTRATPA